MSIRQRTIALSILLLCHTFVWGQDEQARPPVEKPSKDVHKLRPQFPTEVLYGKSVIAVQDGLNYLATTQNKDGSWGSHDPKLPDWKDLAFSVRNRASHDAVRIACTAICADTLMKQESRTKQQQEALDKAIQLLIQDHKFTYEPGTSFNTWGYGYKLAFLLELSNAPEGKTFGEKIKAAAQTCVDGLKRYQQHTGGWSYYAGPSGNADNMSFNTCLFALSLSRAKEMGCDVPDGMIKDATLAVNRMRAPNGNFAYDSRFETNKSPSALKGGLGGGARTMAATHALYKLGRYSTKDLQIGLRVFDDGENYLESGRKLIQPHSAPHQISGYFFFFGYNYATAGAEALGDAVTQERWDRFCWTMLRTQEKNGCWWDTAWADYGEKWGTGFAVRTLQRYLNETGRRIPELAEANDLARRARQAIEQDNASDNDGENDEN